MHQNFPTHSCKRCKLCTLCFILIYHTVPLFLFFNICFCFVWVLVGCFFYLLLIWLFGFYHSICTYITLIYLIFIHSDLHSLCQICYKVCCYCYYEIHHTNSTSLVRLFHHGDALLCSSSWALQGPPGSSELWLRHTISVQLCYKCATLG